MRRRKRRSEQEEGGGGKRMESGVRENEEDIISSMYPTIIIYLVENDKEHSEPRCLQFGQKGAKCVETLLPFLLLVIHCHVRKVILTGSSTVSK